MYSPIVDRKIRIGLLGCGRISMNHVKAVQAHDEDLELAAVCDIQPQRLDEVAGSTGAAGFARLEDMLKIVPLDVVAICTPSGLHAEQAVQIASHGVHVMTEKPMATRWDDGLRMVKACDDAGIRLFVVKQNRRNATLQLLKKAVEQRRFGRVYSVAVNVFWTRPQEYYDSAKWRGTWEFDGGAFMNQASHYIDLLDWLVGPVESVMAYTATLARNIEVEDSGVAAWP
jgi:UDP-N-acetyl-2-amino-2-deoxyglucuronate dehydrogenase